MIDKIAAKHGMIAVARVAGEAKRLAPWNKPFRGSQLGEIEKFDAGPIFKAYTGVDPKSVEAWVLESLEQDVLRVLRESASRGVIQWPAENLTSFSGSNNTAAASHQISLIKLARDRSLNLYAFSLWSNYIMFFAREGWENTVFFSDEAESVFGRFATGAKKYLESQRAN